MKQNQHSFEILSVVPMEPGQASLARISFAFKPSELLPLIVEQSSLRSGQYKNYTVAEVFGADRVIVKSAFLKRSAKGDLFVQVPHIKLPWQFSRDLAETAYLQLEVAEEVSNG